MKFLPKWKAPKLSKTRSNKKVILATLKGGTKWLGAGLLMGTGAEIASHVASKSQAGGDGQYVSITDFGPALIREDSVEASSNGQRQGLFGTRHPYIFGIPTFLIAILVVLACRFCWKRLVCLGGLTSCCKDPKPKDSTDGPTTQPHQEAVDMEAVFTRLENEIHSPVAVAAEGESHYATPKKRLEETLNDIKESCANRAKRAHELDSSLHST